MNAAAWVWYVAGCLSVLTCTACAVAFFASAGRQRNPYKEWADLGSGTFLLTLSIVVAFNIPGWNG